MSLGYQNLKEVVQFGLQIGMGVDKSTEDGEWSFSDAAHFIDAVKAAPPAIKDFGQVDDELKKLSDDKRKKFMAEIKAEFDLRDDKVEEIVETSLGLALQIGKLVFLFRG